MTDEEQMQDTLGLYLNTLIKIQYTNWRGENSLRSVIPRKILFGSTEWHPSKQWLLYAHDVDKNDMRSFAIKDIEAFFIEHKGSKTMTDTDDLLERTKKYLDIKEQITKEAEEKRACTKCHEGNSYTHAYECNKHGSSSWFIGSNLSRLLECPDILIRELSDKLKETEGLQEKVEKLQERLEITHLFQGEDMKKVEIPQEERDDWPDGILCRDATIEIMDDVIDKQKEKLEKLREALDLIADGSEDIWEMYPEDCEGKAVRDFAKEALKKE